MNQRPDQYHYVVQNYRSCKALAESCERSQDHEQAQRFWRDADGWRRFAANNGVQLPQ